MAQSKTELLAVMQLLKKYNLKGTEELLRREANLAESAGDPVPADSDVSSVLAAYKSEGDPEIYEQSYLELRRFVDESLDIYKVRLRASYDDVIAATHYHPHFAHSTSSA